MQIATLSEADRRRITDAVRAAEALTSAEIVVVVDRIAGSWRSWPLMLAFGLALVLPWPLIELTSLATRTIFALQLLTATALALALQPLSVRLALVPRFLKRRKAREAAERQFCARGVANTAGRTGVLIYVALAERHAAVLTDSAVHARFGDDAWRELIAGLIGEIRSGRLAEGLIGAVTTLSARLAADFPVQPGDRDELDNKVVVL
jgi:putative membrane protein